MKLQYIQSKNNELLKQIRKLKEKKYRDKNNMFIVEGIRFVEEAIKSCFIIKYIFISEEINDNHRVRDMLNNVDSQVKLYSVSSDILKTLCNTENPQGIIAIVENRNIILKDEEGFLIFVDKVQDPGNMGTIIRTAHAAGALGIILRKGTVDVFNEKTLRSTMGSIFHVPIIYDKDIEYLNELKNKDYRIISSYLQTDKNFYDLNLKQKVVLVVGNEGNGISDEVIDISDELVRLPMPGNAESLNVAVCAGIMMYEVVRQIL